MWGKGNIPPLLVGVSAGTVTLDTSITIFQKIRKKPTSSPNNIVFGYIPKECSIYHKDMCSAMFIAALFVIARTWKQLKCPSAKGWMRNMWYIYTTEYYTVEKDNDILESTYKWMDLENIILSEVTQTQ